MVRNPCVSMVVCVLIVALASSARAQQTSEVPRSEVGVSLVARASSGARPGFSPRVAWNISDRTALEAFVDIGREGSIVSRTGSAPVVLFGQLKRTLVQGDVGDLFVVAGMHVSYWRRQAGGFSVTTPDGTSTFGSRGHTRRDWWKGVSIGGGYAVPINRRLHLRVDAQFGSTNDGPLVRTSIGAAVRLGWRELRTKAVSTQAHVPGSRKIRRIVWVTMSDGRELTGMLLSLSAGDLELWQADGVTRLSLADVRQIED